MKKKKLYGVITSSVLALTVSVPSLSGSVPAVSAMVEGEEQLVVELSSLVDTDLEEVRDFINDVYFTLSSSEELVLVNENSSTYQLLVETANDQIVVEDESEITLGNDETSISINILDEEDVVETITIDTTEIQEALSESPQVEESTAEEVVEGTDQEEEEIVEEIEEEASEETVVESTEDVENIEEESEETEDEESDEELYPELERHSDVHQQLHGDEGLETPTIMQNRVYTSSSTPFSTPQGFIDHIAPLAIEIAGQSGEEALYPSLMIAQAAHESNYGRSALGRPPYHNLGGIKGTYNGQSVTMRTWEEKNGQRVEVDAQFRSYPSYRESLQDYANLLRYGVSWDANYYSGTWRRNTNSVWDVINNRGLAGYATDSNYYNAITRVINQYNLTQYDSGTHYARSGTFFSENSARSAMNTMRRLNQNLSYSVERENNREGYRNRRVESTEEFVGEAAAQRAVNQIRNQTGWYATYRQTNNSTGHVRVQSGFFNSRASVESAVNRFRNEYGLHASVVRGNDGRYRMQTGWFVGEERAQVAIDYMNSLGWYARTVDADGSTPHYVVYTGVFPNPSAVTEANNYFRAQGWGSRETMVDRYTYYYRVFVNGFASQNAANNFGNQVGSRYGWHMQAFPND